MQGKNLAFYSLSVQNVLVFMPRLHFTLSYDGRPYSGWQSQLSGCTVQDEVERAFECLLKRKVRIHASGRTDTGVHALGQVFHLDFEENPTIPLDQWHMALNALLPGTIRILSVREVPPRLHARYDAVEKTYEYRINPCAILPPFEYGLVWHLPREWDAELLRAAVALFEGTHDFRAFAARRGNEPDPIPEGFYLRTISEASLSVDAGHFVIRFRGNGFLYKMVRLMVGAAHTVARGKLSLEGLKVLLENPGDKKSPLCAPPDGLRLVSVRYE